MPSSAMTTPHRLRTFGHGDEVLDFPVDVLGRHRFRSSLQPGTVTVTRAADPTAAIGFTGTSILFNKRTWIGSREMGFWEQIAPQAVTKTLLEADIRFLQNHNPDLLLARTNPQMRALGTDTLTLTANPTGLGTDADMAPVSYAQDLAVLLDRGDISQMSFAFDPLEWIREELPDGTLLITITALRLYDVSVVTYPAYEETDAGLRAAAFDAICRDGGLDPVDVLKRYAQGGPPVTVPEITRTAAPPTPTKRDRLVPTELRALNGWTLDDLWPILDKAIVELLSTETFNAYWYVWLVDVSDEWLVFCDDRPGSSFPSLFKVDYAVDEQGVVTLGEPVAVVAKTTYMPLPESDAGADDDDVAARSGAGPDALRSLQQRTRDRRTADLTPAAG